MCTAIKYENYFGRNLDLWCRYDTKVIINRNGKYPVMGMGIEANGYPLYFDAMNDRGLAMAGLNFPGNAVYFPLDKHRINLAPYELIPYIIGNFSLK